MHVLERHEHLRIALEERGMTWPLGHYAPGLYGGPCRTCGEEMMGDKYARQCLPCAILDELTRPVRPNTQTEQERP